MAKLRYSVNNKTSWTVLEGSLPLVIPSTNAQKVFIESFGARVTLAGVVTPPPSPPPPPPPAGNTGGTATVNTATTVDDAPGAVIFDFSQSAVPATTPAAPPSVIVNAASTSDDAPGDTIFDLTELDPTSPDSVTMTDDGFIVS